MKMWGKRKKGLETNKGLKENEKNLFYLPVLKGEPKGPNGWFG